MLKKLHFSELLLHTMPLRHGLDVSIVSSALDTFTEYGVNTHARSKLVTAKIEARTGVQFFIAIHPEVPFPTEQKKQYRSSRLTRAQTADHSKPPSDKTPPAPRKKILKTKLSNLDTNESVEKQVDKPRQHDEEDRNLVVENLPRDIDEVRLAKEFQGFGELTHVRVARYPKTGHSKGYACLHSLLTVL